MTARGDGSRRWYPPRSRPRSVEGGIRAHSRRGAFGESWWARRWTEVLEGFGIGARLGRGKRYARGGQVLSLEIEPGRVASRVQGSRARPYRVQMGLATLTESEREALYDRLSGEARFAARLLAGEMPVALEEAFEAAGRPLFPERHADLATTCSCPDWSNPCKHIAAVYLLLAEEFDRNPWLLLRLRGIRREELVERLGPETPAAEGKEPGTGPEAEELTGGRTAAAAVAAPDSGREFWGGWPGDPDGSDGENGADGEKAPAGSDASGRALPLPEELPEDPASLPRSLGNFPFWRGERPLLEVLTEVYRRAEDEAMRLLGGGEE